jgi:hypothetical protein
VETSDERRPVADRSAAPQWSSFGLVVTVLVAGAFATGWHFGRRWGRLMGW